MLQDANYNVVALVSGGWTGTGDPPVNYASPGTILEQYTYEPYGSVIAAESFYAHAVNRVGFQGLFFERYDGDYTNPAIAPGVTGLYHARNRFYKPVLGRFIQRDVNETALPIITALAMNERAMSILMSGFNVQGLYGDGMNLYMFAGANPVNLRDPSGLFTYLDTLETAANTAIIWGMTWATIHPTAMALAGGILAAANLYMLAVDPDYQAMVMSQPNAMGFIEADIQEILRAGGSLKGLARVSPGVARLALAGGCFAAGTQVTMADGSLRPIDQVCSGESVLCWTGEAGDNLIPSEVLSTSHRRTASLLRLCTSSGSEILVTPDHPFYVDGEGRGWVSARDLGTNDALWRCEESNVTVVGSEALQLETDVYNLQVATYHNYLITGDRLLVHNGSMMPSFRTARPMEGVVSYLMDPNTGEMWLGSSAGVPHMLIWGEYAGGRPLSEFVGGFASFSGGKFIGADLSSATFSGTQPMIDAAMQMFSLLLGK